MSEETEQNIGSVSDLYQLCKTLVEKGFGSSPVMFDTDAQHFACHLIPVDFGCFSSEDLFGVLVLANTEPYGTYAEKLRVGDME